MKNYSYFGPAARAGLIVAAFLGAATPVKADTIVKNFEFTGTATQNDSGFDGITSSDFSDFDPALGTLTGVTLSFSGTAIFSGPDVSTASATDVTTASNVHQALVTASGFGLGLEGHFQVSANGTDSYSGDLTMFEGSGTQALILDFDVGSGTVTMDGQAGTLTYDYTPAASPVDTPEADSLSLFATGLAGLLFLGRFGFPASGATAAAFRRFARIKSRLSADGTGNAGGTIDAMIDEGEWAAKSS